MTNETSVAPEPRPEILFLFPLVYRPEKDNFGKKFAQLAKWYRCYIFTLSGSKCRNVPHSGFLFNSEIFPTRRISRIVSGLWIQVGVPIGMFLGKRSVSVVIAYDPFRSGLSALVLKYLLRCKLIVELNGDYHRTEPGKNSLNRKLMRVISQVVLSRADAIKVLNADQEQYCKRCFSDRPLFRFPPYVATDYFRSLECHQGRYLLSIGHPFDLKGMDVLIVAFLKVSEKFPQFSLRIMGHSSSDELARYMKLAAGHPRIEFIRPGWIEDVGQQISNCYALVNAANTEAMGRVHIEAMTCGKPIVATRTNGAQECVDDGETGLLCEIGDPDDLAARLAELLSDPSRAMSMGRAGSLRVEKMFSEERYILEVHNMLRKVIGGPSWAA
jgi:glycosyltransferase involved in cell wall biosynthesis